MGWGEVIYVHLLKCNFLKFSRKNPETFPAGAFLFRVADHCLSKCTDSKKGPLSYKSIGYAPDHPIPALLVGIGNTLAIFKIDW